MRPDAGQVRSKPARDRAMSPKLVETGLILANIEPTRANAGNTRAEFGQVFLDFGLCPENMHRLMPEW